MVPAQRPWPRNQPEHRRQPQSPVSGKGSPRARAKDDQRQQKSQARSPGPGMSVEPFPEEDELERGLVHPAGPLSNLYSAVSRYLANSACHAASVNGGRIPVRGRHSIR